jgi:hypothetical protein
VPGFEIRDLYQRAVLWPATGGNDRFGQPTVGAPVEIAVRWLDIEETVMDPKGNLWALKAKVVVAQQVKMGSRMWLGQLSDWYATGSAGQPDDLTVCISFDRTPDMKNRWQRRELGLMRHQDQNVP